MHEVESQRIDVAITGAQEAKQTVDAFGLHSLGAEGPEPKTWLGRIYLLRVGVAGIVNNHARGQGNVVSPAAKDEHRFRRKIRVFKQVFLQFRRRADAQRFGAKIADDGHVALSSWDAAMLTASGEPSPFRSPTATAAVARPLNATPAEGESKSPASSEA